MGDRTAIDSMKEAILKDFPRMAEQDSFRFACSNNSPCFTQCCGDVNIVLTPYDVMRLKNHLGLTSEEFVDKHALLPFRKGQQLPTVMLRMRDNEGKTCPFVTQEGCSVYNHRPWACRMYPVGVASPNEGDGKFYFLMTEDLCKGHGDGPTWTIRSWMDNQGVAEYDELGEEFKAISLHDYFLSGGELAPPSMEMFFMVCYNIDKFRRFVFESSFLQKFDIEQELVEKARADDVDLMKLGFQWLRMCIFKEQTFKVRDDIREAKAQSVG